jgi:cytochrome c peroxidase
VPGPDHPGRTDLGLWNTFQNPDFADPAAAKARALMVCRALGTRVCAARRRHPAAMLEAAVALFKTPSLRDLGHTAPYLHTGRKDTLEDVVRFYEEMGDLARRRQVRNAAPALAGVALGDDDVQPLAAFLRALNEDFE